MFKIEIDSEVYEFLQQRATPFIDTPNDVLRRLLLARTSESGRTLAQISRVRDLATPPLPVSAEQFVQEYLATQFGRGFERRPPYRMMFESEGGLVYFQNFNKESDHLWYRVTPNPWKDLRESLKPAWIVLTNPVERFGYSIPVADLNERIKHAGWSRNYLEINIDPSNSRWSELDWTLMDYRKSL